MPRPSPVQRLRNLNALLSAANPGDRARVVEIQKAVQFFIDEVQEQSPNTADFPAFAKQILAIHLERSDDFGLAFWSVEVKEEEMLWLRSEFLEQLQSLRGYSAAAMVIFGLQDSVVEDQKYWTTKMEKRYADIRDYLEKVAVDWQSHHGRLSLIYI